LAAKSPRQREIDDSDTIKVVKKDFGLSNFNEFKKKIFTDFRDSVTHWLNNKNYNIRK
jgi:hypothetical protein